MRILRGGLRKSLDTRKGDPEKIIGLGLGGWAPKICILQNQQEGGGGFLKNCALAREAAKISSFEFHPPFIILNELCLKPPKRQLSEN